MSNKIKVKQWLAIICLLLGFVSSLPVLSNLFHMNLGNNLLFCIFQYIFVFIFLGILAFAAGIISFGILPPTSKMKYMSLAGLILGIVGVSNITEKNDSFAETYCAGQLVSLGCAIRMYSQEYGEHFPDKDGAAGLDQLRSGGYCENLRMYMCPSKLRGKEYRENQEITEEITGFTFVGGLNESCPIDSPIMFDKEGNHKSGYRHVLFLDGHVGRGKGDKWLEEAKTNIFHKDAPISWEYLKDIKRK